MLARFVVAALASLIVLGALALPATAHDPVTPNTIQIKVGGQFHHWHGPTTPVATVFRDVTIVWRWDGSAWSQAYIPRINRGTFDLEEDDFLWVVAPRAFTITLEPDPVLTAAPCTGDDYDRDEWGSYPPAPGNATPTWTKPHDAVNSRAIAHDHHVALRDAHVSGGCHWSAAMKDRFSSDLANLNPSAQSFNASKGSRTPDQLTGIAARIIDTAPEQCAYARQHRDVKEVWGLTMTTSEATTVDAWIAGCTSTTSGDPAVETETEAEEVGYWHAHCARNRVSGGCDQRFRPSYYPRHWHPDSVPRHNSGEHEDD